jgi:hypothetical protein
MYHLGAVLWVIDIKLKIAVNAIVFSIHLGDINYAKFCRIGSIGGYPGCIRNKISVTARRRYVISN